MAEQYDIIIVGGGPSGSICALFLKKLNPSLKVCIVEKKSFPRDKACGDGLSPGVIDILKEAGLEHLLTGKRPIGSFMLSWDDTHQIRYALKRLSQAGSEGYVYPRKDLDTDLINGAIDHGVTVYSHCTLTEVVDLNNEETEIVCSSGTEQKKFKASVLIGADGANSTLRKILNIPPNKEEHKGLALRYYCRIEPYESLLKIDLFKGIHSAYGWVFPASENIANIGVGADSQVLRKGRTDINSLFSVYMSFLEKKYQVKLIPGTKAGYTLPYGSQLPPLVHQNKVLIGDAASMINPLTGEGIFYGMYAGKTLAYCLAHQFRNKEEREAALHDFSQQFRREFERHYQLNARIKQLLSSPFAGLLLKTVTRDQALLHKVMNIVMGNAEDIYVPNLTWKMIRNSSSYMYDQLKTYLPG